MKMFSVLRESQLDKFVTAEQKQPEITGAEQVKETQEKSLQGSEAVLPM